MGSRLNVPVQRENLCHLFNEFFYWNVKGIFFGAFAYNLENDTVFNLEIHGYIFALEFAAQNRWSIWLESDSTGAFKISSLVLILLLYGWHNACSLDVQVILSHIYREGNYCADKLANMGTQFRVQFS